MAPLILFHVIYVCSSPWCCQRLTAGSGHWWDRSPQRCLLAATSACAPPWSPRTSRRKTVPRSPREGSVQTHQHIPCWVSRATHVTHSDMPLAENNPQLSSGFTWLSWASAALSSTKYIPDFPVRQNRPSEIWCTKSKTNTSFPYWITNTYSLVPQREHITLCSLWPADCIIHGAAVRDGQCRTQK